MSFQKFTQALRNVSTAVTDVYFNLVTLLLNTNGVNNAQNNTFLDSSSNAIAITRNGTFTQGTFTPFSQTGWSANFDGSTSYLTAADTANLKFGSGNLTIEAFVYRAVSGAAQTIAAKGAATPTGWAFQISAADKLQFVDTNANVTSTTSLVAGTWYYVAAVRAGTGTNQTTLYINAASDATGNSATNFNQTNNLLVGANRSTANFANGYISNLRLSNIARTISSVPTTGLTADANTIFLATNVNRFTYTDSTLANTAMTVTGTPSVQSFSPFAPTAAYSTSNIGGSGYSSANTTFLSNTTYNTTTTGDFTVEGWAYFNDLAQTNNVLVNLGNENTGRWFFGVVSNGSLRINPFGGANINFGAAGAVIPNSWNHIAWVRSGSGSNNITAYVNGTSVGTGTNTSSAGNAGGFLVSASTAGNFFANGYVSNIRIILGAAVYSGNFTVPTAPFTASMAANPFGGTNTAAATATILLNYTNASIYDSTAKNDLETVGNASVSTAQTNFGNTSIFFNGTNSALVCPGYPLSSFTSNDFTVEFFMNLPSLPAAATYVVNAGPNGAGAVRRGWGVRIHDGSTANLTFIYQDSGSQANGFGPLPSINSFHHIAFSRNGSSLRCFVDGNQLGSTWNLTSNISPLVSTDLFCLGAYTNTNGSPSRNWYNGYLFNPRITNGVGRYTSNFTVTTTTFPVQ